MKNKKPPEWNASRAVGERASWLKTNSLCWRLFGLETAENGGGIGSMYMLIQNPLMSKRKYFAFEFP
jgi:hypothetical protein